MIPWACLKCFRTNYQTSFNKPLHQVPCTRCGTVWHISSTAGAISVTQAAWSFIITMGRNGLEGWFAKTGIGAVASIPASPPPPPEPQAVKQEYHIAVFKNREYRFGICMECEKVDVARLSRETNERLDFEGLCRRCLRTLADEAERCASELYQAEVGGRREVRYE